MSLMHIDLNHLHTMPHFYLPSQLHLCIDLPLPHLRLNPIPKVHLLHGHLLRML